MLEHPSKFLVQWVVSTGSWYFSFFDPNCLLIFETKIDQMIIRILALLMLKVPTVLEKQFWTFRVLFIILP